MDSSLFSFSRVTVFHCSRFIFLTKVVHDTKSNHLYGEEYNTGDKKYRQNRLHGFDYFHTVGYAHPATATIGLIDSIPSSRQNPLEWQHERQPVEAVAVKEWL